MHKTVWYGIIFLLLLVGFGLLFGKIQWLQMMGQLLQQTKKGMDEAARRRLLESRRQLLLLQRRRNVWYRLEQELHYSGWKRYFPFLSAEIWLMCNVVAAAVIFVVGLLLTEKCLAAGAMTFGCMGVELVLIWLCKLKEIRSVNDNLLKFLNFLGNYSITAGEITGVFKQVSRYVEEPLKSALSECCYEAQVTGDVSQALLAMSDKIEHPKFKELARNMDISIRYCANFSLLVDGSRRSVREYLRQGEERRGMLREAVVNMLLLFAMSVFALLTVEQLIEASVWDILWETLPGRAAVSIVAVVIVLLAKQLHKVHR